MKVTGKEVFKFNCLQTVWCDNDWLKLLTEAVECPCQSKINHLVYGDPEHCSEGYDGISEVEGDSDDDDRSYKNLCISFTSVSPSILTLPHPDFAQILSYN